MSIGNQLEPITRLVLPWLLYSLRSRSVQWPTWQMRSWMAGWSVSPLG